MKNKHIFIANSVLLTAVTLSMRAVSIFFHIYLANKIGSAGMGLFSLIMSVYNFGVTFACSGIQLTSTKIVSEELATRSEKGIRVAVFRACTYGFFFGSVAFLLIFFGAPYVGTNLLGDVRTILPLKILSVSLPCVAVSAALGGYFTAVGRVYKNAIAMVAEQIIRVGGCIYLFSVFDAQEVQMSCNAVVIAGSCAEILSFFMMLLLFKVDCRRYKNNGVGENITKRMLGISVPVAVSSYVRAGLNTVEHSMIPKGLARYGQNTERALSSYGVVHGMVMPLIFFPSAILQAISTLLIPEITKYYKQGSTKKINRLIESSLYVTLVFSIGASGILYFFAEEIGMTFYNNPETAQMLHFLAPLAAVMYADGVVDALLKGLNQQVYSMSYNISDSVLAIFLILFLLPVKGISGYILILYITEMFNAYLSINRLIKVADFTIYPFRWTVIPVCCTIASSCFVKSIFPPITGITGLFISVAFAAVIYGFIMLIYSRGNRIKTLFAKHIFLWYN